MRNKYFIFTLLFGLSLGADLGSKVWARHHLQPLYPKAMTIISGFFDFQYAENKGMAFSLFANKPWFHWVLFPIAILCLGMVFLWLRRLPQNACWTGAKLGLLAGGALGNIIDRLAYGKVTDFVVWKITTSTHVYQWPTFNLADAFLVVGVILLILNWPKDKEDTTETSSKIEGPQLERSSTTPASGRGRRT